MKEDLTDEGKVRKRLLMSRLQVLKKYKLMKQASKKLGLRWQTVVKYNRCDTERFINIKRKRREGLSAQLTELVKKYFVQNSTPRPDERSVSRKTNLQRRDLDKCGRELHREFRKVNPDISISFSAFWNMRPENVKPLSKKPIVSCLCEYCTNIELKIKVFNGLARKANVDIIKDKYELNRILLCPKSEGKGHYARKCVERACQNCGVSKLEAKLLTLNCGGNENISWQVWKYVEEEYRAKTGEGKNIKKKKLVNQEKSFTNFCTEFADEAQSFSAHLFNAKWQFEQYKSVSSSPPPGAAVIVMDFAENFTTLVQNEIQSAHWARNQITLFPVCMFYICDQCKFNCKEVVEDTIIFLSQDLKHDHNFVYECTIHIVEYLKQKIPQLDSLIQFTDGCSAQFKSKNPFMDISFSEFDFNIITARHFFGTRHGKGPCDAAGGVVKSLTRRAIIGQGMTINNADEMYSVCRSHFTKLDQHRKRSFMKIDTVNRSGKRQASKTISGTRKLHAISSLQKPGSVLKRNLSCFCVGCLEGGECSNATHVDPWLQDSMELEVVTKIRKESKEIIEIDHQELQEDTLLAQKLIAEIEEAALESNR